MIFQEINFWGKRCPTPKINSSDYLSIKAFFTTLAAEEVLRNIPARIAISARSALLLGARFAKELAGNLKTSFPFESRSPSTIRSIQKNNSQ
jgi:hypothetical protein